MLAVDRKCRSYLVAAVRVVADDPSTRSVPATV
jgi:hypothetical protein